MTDEAKALVERLREVGRDGTWKSGRNLATTHPMCATAADLIETQAREIERLREELAEAYIKLSGKSIHTSDCATSNAPAMKPGPCDCAALEAKQ